MHFLISNDDGFRATGIVELAKAISTLGSITVVAPDQDRSGASNSLTLNSPLRPQIADNGFYYVNGTPTDCVHLAITGLIEHELDMVISGINSGPNLGDDVLYSGTVAAAMEGRFLGKPAIALSLAGETPSHYATAVQVALKIIPELLAANISNELLLNINIPDVPFDELNGYEVTRLGNRHKSEPVIQTKDPRGKEIYWVGAVGAEQDAGSGTDFYAIKQNKVSITPLSVDLTAHKQLDNVSECLRNLTP